MNELIPNPGFEEFLTCPDQIGQIDRATGWFSPNAGTPDFYNGCAGNLSGVGVGVNSAGYQQPKQGKGMAGVLIEEINLYDSISPIGWYREYLSIKLNEPLKQGQYYNLTFFICLAEISNYATKELGGYFSKESLYNSTTMPFVLNAQIKSDPNEFLVDTSTWQAIEGEFLAEGGEQFLTIGLFTESIDTLPANPLVASSTKYCYYYVDGLKLVENLVLSPIYLTPNSDGINDIVNFNSILSSEVVRVIIYSRWGNIVFECHSDFCEWNGKKNGKRLPNGTYFFVASVEFSEKKSKGTIYIY